MIVWAREGEGQWKRSVEAKLREGETQRRRERYPRSPRALQND
jgi:hypothetical protein